jgi:PAB-dependent poly(A)-specific ribonuclease subunit 2
MIAHQRLTVSDAGDQNRARSPWYLFNDFVVENISEEEALSIPEKWKVGGYMNSITVLCVLKYCQVPAIIYFERCNLQESLTYDELPDKVDESILSTDTSISRYVSIRFTPGY